jgi:hypothetical protein
LRLFKVQVSSLKIDESSIPLSEVIFLYLFILLYFGFFFFTLYPQHFLGV